MRFELFSQIALHLGLQPDGLDTSQQAHHVFDRACRPVKLPIVRRWEEWIGLGLMSTTVVERRRLPVDGRRQADEE
jgi:hypothetical protein